MIKSLMVGAGPAGLNVAGRIRQAGLLTVLLMLARSGDRPERFD